MAYQFEKETAASFKFGGTQGSIGKLTLNGINANEDAQTVITGIQGLLYIVNRVNSYNPLDGIRTVKEDVIDDE